MNFKFVLQKDAKLHAVLQILIFVSVFIMQFLYYTLIGKISFDKNEKLIKLSYFLVVCGIILMIGSEEYYEYK